MIKSIVLILLFLSAISLKGQDAAFIQSEPIDTLTNKLSHHYIQEISIQAPIKILSPKQWPGG